MPRIRTIKPEFFDDEELVHVSPDLAVSRTCRLLYAGLWPWADKAGRLEDRPERIKARVLPHDTDVDAAMVDQMLDLLARARFIIRYEVDGHKLLQVRTFGKHQHLSTREAESELPAPPERLLGRHKYPPKQAQVPAEAGARARAWERKGKGKERSTDSPETVAEADRSAPSVAPILEFSTVGAEKRWDLTSEQVASWQTDYPGLDILGECRKAHAWVEANQTNRKTARGMPAFLVRWLNRAVKDGHGREPPAQAVDPRTLRKMRQCATCQQYHFTDEPCALLLGATAIQNVRAR